MAEIISQRAEELVIQMRIKLNGSMMDMENAIQQELNEAGCAATKEALKQFEATGQNIQMGETKFYCKGKVKKEYETPYGKVPLDRYVYQGVKGGKTFAPLDQRARIIEHSTPKFAKMVTYKYTAMSAVDAAEDLQENHGRHVCTKYIQKVSDYVGTIVQASEEHWDYAVPEQKENITTVSVSLDGTMMLMVGEGYREAMTGNISLYNGQGERVHTIYIGAAPEHGKQIFLDKLQQEIDRIKLKYPDAHYVGIADGAVHNWKFLEPNTEHHILDFYHATEYLADVSHAFCPDHEGKRKKWLDDACHELKHTPGGAADMLRQMKDKKEEIEGKKRIHKTAKEALNKAITYFENQFNRMDYPTYCEKNMPIGSGVTEAACKVLIKERLCKSGMQWKNAGAKTVLSLRALVKTTDRWQQFWQKITQNGWDDLLVA